jgi:hypothetical protein
MPTEMKLWTIEGEEPKSLAQGKLDLESRLEDWINKDIGLISNDLLLIGRQVLTDYGGSIDLLAIDPEGNLVILELKRDKTPRDIVSQLLDYASWVQDLGHESIEEIANKYFRGKTLEDAFREQFGSDLPDVLNERHRMYVVASSLDTATERIVKYLSETHDVDINVATFAYFPTSEGELLGRSLLLDEAEVRIRASGKSKRTKPRTFEELQKLAEEHGVLELFNHAYSELRPLLDGSNRQKANIALVGFMGENKSRNVIISIYPEASSTERGLALLIFFDRLCEYFSITEESARDVLGPHALDAETWNPNATWFFDSERLDRLIELLKQAKQV